MNGLYYMNLLIKTTDNTELMQHLFDWVHLVDGFLL